tara:strand:- start:554 stop:1186 length:633 start_codon:yes stop_codon:yes gene_type:complete
MRIGSWELQSIRNQILRDLYSKEEENHTKRKIEIVQQNREYYIKPFQTVLENLPLELVDEHKDFITEIKYSSPNTNNEAFDVNESWTFTSEVAVTNPVKKRVQGGYSQSPPASQPLDPRLKNITDQLCEEIITLRTKRKETHDYLIATTHKFTGSLQLRKEWPAAFHKYLPPEPIKVAKPAKETKKLVVDGVALPNHIHETMTNNLLEGD